MLKTLSLTQLIATYDLDLAWELCERTIILSQGQIVYNGDTDRIMSDQNFLKKQDLEPPFSYSRPYCNLGDAP